MFLNAQVEAVMVILVGLALSLVLAVRLIAAIRSRHGGGPPVSATGEGRLVQATRVAGLLAGASVGWQVFDRGSYGTGPMLAPAAFGLCVLVGVVVGETVVRPRRIEGPRTAWLETRRVRDHVPPATTKLVIGALLLEVVTLALTTATASYDQYTRGARALACRADGVTGQETPYPGSYYSFPLGLMLLAVLLVAVVAVRQVVRRPRGLSTSYEGDDLLRRRSADVVVSATGIAVCAPFVGIALSAGTAMLGLTRQPSSCAPGWMSPAGTLLIGAALLAVVVGVWCVVRLLSPAPRIAVVPVDEPLKR